MQGTAEEEDMSDEPVITDATEILQKQRESFARDWVSFCVVSSRVKAERDVLLDACKAVSDSATEDYKIDLKDMTAAIHKVRAAIAKAEV